MDTKNALQKLRQEINSLDEKIVALIDKRACATAKVAHLKNKLKMPATDSIREGEVVTRLQKVSRNPLVREYLVPIYDCLFALSKKQRGQD